MEIGLSKKLYKVRVPVVATYTEAELDVIGLHVAYDNKNKKKMQGDELEFTTVMLPLDRLFDIYQNGYPIYLVNQNDLSSIYKNIEDYLIQIKNKQVYSPNQLPIEDDRIYEIENFANEIFGYNKISIVKSSLTKSTGYTLGIQKLNIAQHAPKQGTDEVKTMNRVMDGYSVSNVGIGINNDDQPIVDYESIKRKNIVNDYDN